MAIDNMAISMYIQRVVPLNRAWLWDSDDPLIRHLSVKVEDITGLKTDCCVNTAAEPFQVVDTFKIHFAASIRILSSLMT